MKRNESDSARPGQDRMGSAQPLCPSPRRGCCVLLNDCVRFGPLSISQELFALWLSVPALSLYHVHVTRSGRCQWKLKGTSHVMALLRAHGGKCASR